MQYSDGVINFTLDENLSNFDTYISEPFIIFEKKDFLELSTYKKLVDEVYRLQHFDYVFKGMGEKEKFSITEANLDDIEDGVLKRLCIAFFSDDFFRWFETTHLPHFERKNKKYIRIKNPKSFLFKVIRNLKTIFNIPISFFSTDVEYSSIKKGGYITPHSDSKFKRLSFVFYLPSNSEDLTEKMKQDLGTVFWKAKSSAKNPFRRFDCSFLESDERDKFYEDFEVMHISSYEPNKFSGFIKSDNSWHTVEKFEQDYDRRALVINILEI